MAYMANAAAQAGLWLTVKGKPNTPPETPPREPSPVLVVRPAEPEPIPAQVPRVSNSGDSHTGSGIRKRGHKCGHCRSTFPTAARHTEHIQKVHATKLADAAASVTDNAAQK
ncbi:hypothetical protein QM012_007924 [Aureobasidium pullulans]|uniref:C2H2-type domain-containing protein n=1 Tax=Aureobasidium pullulans TaxID=5580 RepID=A0ABR0TL29_AURPU